MKRKRPMTPPDSTRKQVLGLSTDRDLLKAQELYLLRQESALCYRIDSNYLFDSQIDQDHRKTLVEWILKLCKHYYPGSLESYFLAVNYLDRIGTRMKLYVSSYQLVGAACFLMACKHVESQSPRLCSLVEMGGGAFTTKLLESMELLLAKNLDWRLNASTPLICINVYAELFSISKNIVSKSVLWLQDTQKYYHMLRYPPSVQSMAALLVAHIQLELDTKPITSKIDAHLSQHCRDPFALIWDIQLPTSIQVERCKVDMLNLKK